jgi:Domain of unknown function (DUF4476)
MYPAANLFASVFLTLQYNLLHPMSKLGLVIVLILMAGRTYAQDYFVLIEADNGQPFYVRVDSQLYSSSSRGHLILSQLKDSSYTITIGFPGQVFPERQFSFGVHQNDHAFRLKNEDGKGWWLVDDKGQELATVNENSGGASARIPGIKKDDAFSRLMADVVKDTAVMYSTYAVEQETPLAVKSAFADSALANTTSGAATSQSKVAAVPATPASVAPTPAVAAPANDSQALTIGRPADMTASAGHVAHDSSIMSVIRPARDSSALHSIDPTAAVRPADSAVAASRPKDTSLAVHPAGVLSVDSGVARSATVTPIDSGATGRSAAVPIAISGAAARPGLTLMTDSIAGHVVSTPLYRPIARKDTNTIAAPLASSAAPLYRTTGVTMLTEHRSSRSLRQVYTDHDSSGKADTVVIIIPLDTPAQTGHPAVTPRAARMTDSSHLTAPQGHGPNPDTPGFSPSRSPNKSTLPFVNSDCHNFATDYDVDKLRVKMLESARDDDRILTARKVFKMKCFSTRQIRALSEVFTTDAAKFKFLEAAYPFVSDDHFAELSNLLADPVYSGRFRAMTGHP